MSFTALLSPIPLTGFIFHLPVVEVNGFSSVQSNAAVQGPARSAVTTKEDAQKKENKPAPDETEDVYYSRSSGLPIKYLDTTAKSKSFRH